MTAFSDVSHFYVKQQNLDRIQNLLDKRKQGADCLYNLSGRHLCSGNVKHSRKHNGCFNKRTLIKYLLKSEQAVNICCLTLSLIKVGRGR